MFHVVVYDISSSKLERVARICEDFGVRVQKSVFECELDEEMFSRFWTRLEATIDPECDAIVAYPLNLSDQKKIKTMGRSIRSEPGTWVF